MIWILDSEVRSNDNSLVPIVTNENLPENVQFEIHDIGTQTRFGDASVDMVHARSIFMTVSRHMAFRLNLNHIFLGTGLFVYRPGSGQDTQTWRIIPLWGMATHSPFPPRRSRY